MDGLRIRAVVFDFDGTLAELAIDFEKMKLSIGRLASLYLDGSLEVSTSLPVLEWLRYLASEISCRDLEKGRSFLEKGRELITRMEMEAARKGRLFYFTRSVLGYLHQRGVKVGIITRNCFPAVSEVFPDWEKHCDCLLTRDDVPRVKPDPDHLHRALRCLDIPCKHALMVGDHPLDIETGRRAGTFTAGVASGNTGEEDLLKNGATWTASDCKNLISKLATLGLFP